MTIYRECFQHLSQVERRRIVTTPNTRLRLNRGERPEPLPLFTSTALCTVIVKQLGTVQQYPSYPEFYQKLSKHIGVPVEQIVVGAGVEEFIRTLMFLCCEPGERAAVLWPTCAMYDIYAQVFGVDLGKIPTRLGWLLPVGELSYMCDQLGVRVLFLPNPGQPVETYYTPMELSELVKMLAEHDVLLVVDEAHHGFGAESALPLVKDHDNLLVLRTFSKFYGAASIRVGYAVGQPRVIKPLDAARPSGEISGPSMAIASALLDRHEDFEDHARLVAHARDNLVKQIRKMGLKAYGSVGFSVLIEFPSPVLAMRMGDALAERGIYVKTGFPPPVSSCMLLACGTYPFMGEFYSSFEQCWGEVCVG